MNCSIATSRMHDYLDGDLAREDAIRLKAHLLACADCRTKYDELERTDAFVLAALSSDIRTTGGDGANASAALTDRILSGLPKTSRQRAWTRWVRNHPAISVAAVFALVMLSSFITMWEQDNELVVRGSDLAEVIIEGDTVTVPEGAHVNGDLTVENGKTEVYGEIKGNLTVIDGTLNMASTANILGQERRINQALDWVWYKLTHTISGLAS